MSATGAKNAYQRFLLEAKRISRHVPMAKPPRALNAHLLRPSPWASRAGESTASLLPLIKKSEAFARLSAVAPPVSEGTTPEPAFYLQDIPLPLAVTRHLNEPSACLLNESPVGKVTGVRIQVKGRKGSRSVRQVVAYGKLNSSDSSRSAVDFGRSHYIHKRGATGVKVTIGYS